MLEETTDFGGLFQSAVTLLNQPRRRFLAELRGNFPRQIRRLLQGDHGCPQSLLLRFGMCSEQGECGITVPDEAPVLENGVGMTQLAQGPAAFRTRRLYESFTIGLVCDIDSSS
jgi:hypothetical protein